MDVYVEETLTRELREVADGLQVPPMPTLPDKQPRSPRHWQPLLVAASVVLIVSGVVAVTATREAQQPQPAPPGPSLTPSPTTSPTVTVAEIPKTAPTVPYVLGQRLYVDGTRVPGSWWSVWSGDAAWIGIRADNTWWWGWDAEPHEISGPLDKPPVLSPDGRYVGEIATENGKGLLTGFDTRPAGEGLGGVPVNLGDPQDGSAVTVRAVTNDGRVIAQGTKTSVLWLPLVDNSTVDLSVTAPGQVVVGNTPAGLVVTDGDGGTPYLATISDDGKLTPTGDLPPHDDLVVSPGGRWLAWTAPGTTGGEVTAIRSLEAQAVDGTGRSTLTAPDGWGFRVRQWVWEDDRYLVSPVVADGAGTGERMARCDVEQGRCVLVEAP